MPNNVKASKISNAMLGSSQFFHGKMLINGIDISKISLDDYRKKINLISLVS